MNLNIFIALSSSAKNAVNTRLNYEGDDYSGPVSDTEYKIFKRMADHATVQKFFKTPTFAGKTWTLFSLTFDNPNQKLQAALDYLAANRTGHFVIAGAWWWDGRQAGTQFTYDVDGNITGTSGTPTYPIPVQLLGFMPDIVEYDIDGNETSRTPATR